MKVIIKAPGKVPKEAEIANDLKSLQDTVGGYIETVTMGNVIVICNEEGLLWGMRYNCRVKRFPFVGTIIVVGNGGEEFTDCPITLEEFEEEYLHG